MVDYLAVPAELAARTGLPEGSARLLSALEAATGRFIGEVHHSVFLIEDDEVELDGPGRKALFLPGLPVLAVASISIDGELVPSSAYRVSKRTGMVLLKDGRSWPDRRHGIDVVYSHGFDPAVTTVDGKKLMIGVPRDIQSAILDAAEASVNTKAGLAGQSVLGDSVQYGSSNVGATQQWVDAVANYAIQVSTE